MPPPADPTARTAALALLGLSETATGPQIVQAYRRLVRATHPDATGRSDPAAAHEFAAIHDAYQRLAEQPADNPPVAPTRDREPVEEGAAVRERWLIPPRAMKDFPTRAPIIAGPVVITTLPEQQPPEPPGPRRPR